MEDLLSKYWDKIRKAILSRWGHKVKEEDLQKPMNYEQLCKFFGEQCQLRDEEAKEEVRRLMDEAMVRKPF